MYDIATSHQIVTPTFVFTQPRCGGRIDNTDVDSVDMPEDNMFVSDTDGTLKKSPNDANANFAKMKCNCKVALFR